MARHLTGRAKAAWGAAAVGTAVLTATACLAPANAAAGRPDGPRLAGSWHVAFTVKGPNQPSFTAVTASSATNAWAFELAGGAATVAYHFNGSSWHRRPFPIPASDSVISASSSSASNVWALAFPGTAVRFNGRSWATVRSFRGLVGSVLAVSKSDVWVFGAQGPAHSATWHFNGRRWAKVRSGAGLNGASALSSSSIWGFGGTFVAHWNGRAWKKTSVASLLPKNTQLSHSFVAGIAALSARSVYAVASGGRQDEGGPLVLLHYNGRHWRRLALVTKLGGPVAVIADGRGGVWIPVMTGFPGNASMEHFSGGKLRSVKLPVTPPHLALFDAANGRRSTAALAVGYMRKSFNSSNTTAVILRFH